jgi:hypothetical protein
VETERTLPVDFHSLRRAFVTKLAVAGINVQRSMALSGHSDHRTHMLYVGSDRALQEIPAEVVPVLSSGSRTKTPLLPAASVEIRRATQDSNLRPSAPEGVDLRRFAPHGGAGKRAQVAVPRRSGSGTAASGVMVLGGGRIVQELLDTRAALTRQVDWWAAADAAVSAPSGSRGRG